MEQVVGQIKIDSPNKKCGIYKITSPSGRVYIGESGNIYERWYKYKILNCKPQKRIYNSLKKYGWEEHKFEIIEECEFDNLLCRERFWQDHYDVLNGGLNCKLTVCGDLKQVHSEETRDKISKATKGKLGLVGEANPMYGKTGELSPFYGKKHTQESKDKISKGNKGKIVSEGTRQKLREINIGEKGVWYGKKLPYEMREKMSISKMGCRNGSSKLVLHLETGIFYDTAVEASKVCGLNISTFYAYISGRIKKESFNYIYV